MNRKIKVWTYGIAYLSLAVGSGVSIAGNVADTYRVSGAIGRTPDGLDITISAFWPAAVLLAIEMFVSALWPRTTAMQTVRWVGSLGIGFVAMYVSWHHLSDLLSSRGQDGLVSTLGPLAIDGLAIMATGLILSSRGQKMATRELAMANHVLDMANDGQPVATSSWYPEPAMPEDVLASDGAVQEAEEIVRTSWLEGLADRVDSTTTPAVPIIAGHLDTPATSRVNVDSIPDMAKAVIQAWLAMSPEGRTVRAGELDQAVAEANGVSSRTARGWRAALAN